MQQTNDSLISIVMSSDEQLAMPLTVAAFSAVQNLQGRQANLFILDGGISPSSKQKFSRTIAADHIRVHWIQPASPRLDEIFNKHQRHERYPMPAYYRLVLPEILPADVHKVIYLDVDVIVLADLAKLWLLETEPYQFLGVQEPDGPYLIDCYRTYAPDFLKRLNIEELRLRPDHQYCNSGVMVINIDKWRRDDVMDKLLNFVDVYFPPYADQDALNVVLIDQWKAIDPRWNVTGAFYQPQRNCPYSPEQVGQVVRDPFIVHYTGSPKPWTEGPEPCSHPRAFEFLRYAKGTAWGSAVRQRHWQSTARRTLLSFKQIARNGLRRVCPPMLKKLIR
jgi:lipopolysaccharide biosynthesis glycosyltransferase